MSSLKLLHRGGNGVIISAPSSNPAANRTITLNDNYAGDGSFVTANSSGNVGIGNASPQQLLHVWPDTANTTSAYIRVTSGDRNSNTGIDLGSDADGDGRLNLVSNGNLKIYTNNTERMRIDSSGVVFVGTTSSAPHTDGSGISLNPTAGVLVGVDGTHAGIFARHNSNGECVRFQRDNTDVGSIDVTTSSTSYNTSSDYRLKENVVSISDGITRLKTLKPKRFNFIADATKTVDGFLAHEVTAVPEAITGTKDEVDSDNNPVYQGIDQSKLVPLLTAALQEAVAKIEVLETKVAALEAG